MNAHCSRVDRPTREEVPVIPLETRSGIILADVFLTKGERSIDVALYRGIKLIAAESFEGSTFRRVKTDCLLWLSHRRLTDKARVELIRELAATWRLLEKSTADNPFGPPPEAR